MQRSCLVVYALLLVFCSTLVYGLSAKRLMSVQYILGSDSPFGVPVRNERIKVAQNAKVEIPETELAGYACTSLDGPYCEENRQNSDSKMSNIRKC
jgi:hypothetical protein